MKAEAPDPGPKPAAEAGPASADAATDFEKTFPLIYPEEEKK